MEVSVSKIQVEGEHKSCGITSLLYEARKVNRKSKLNDFVEAVQKIDPTLGLVQTCELNTNDPVDAVLKKWEETLDYVSCFSLHFFRAPAAS